MARLRWKEMSMIFQGAMNALNPLHTVADQIGEAVRRHEPRTGKVEIRHRVTELLERVGIPAARRSQYPHQFSGGMRQRVMIAMALACNPPVIIADEPTTALDVLNQARILELLSELRDRLGLAVLLISHDLGVIAELCETVLVLYAGMVVEYAGVDALFNQPQHPYIRQLLAAFPHIDPLSRQLAALPEIPLLQVNNLSKSFVLPGRGLWSKNRYLNAVDDVSFELKRGEILALVGESGCGKSTLLATLIGLEQAAAGTIVYAGRDVSRPNAAGLKALRRRVQMIFQDPYEALNPLMTVGELVAEPLRIHRQCRSADERRQRVSRALEDAGLKPAGDLTGRYPHQLSGGQRQRVVIAAALVLEPELLLADEPVSMLDVGMRTEILNLLAQLRDRRGLSVILVSHDLATAACIADRIAVMYLGRLVELGATHEVLTQPLHPYTRALLALLPVTNPRQRRPRTLLTGDLPDPTAIASGCRFQPRCPVAIERCRRHDPALTPVNADHRAACLLVMAEPWVALKAIPEMSAAERAETRD
jgi:peptide/nickel transport system ATP-binding protein